MTCQMINKKEDNMIYKFTCNLCKFSSNRKYDFERHNNSIKHKKNQIYYNQHKNAQKCVCECGKQYKYKQGLSKHRKTCNYKEINKEINKEICQEIHDKQDNNIIINKNNLENLVVQLITENNEIKNTLLKENQELRQQITELIPKVGNNNTINNNNNNHFNINVFLNEKCKDAMSMQEFVRNIEVSLKNLLTTKSRGISFGINEIINENMNKLSVYERPIHCTDKKRETLYVKHDKWEKDVDKSSTTNMLKGLQLQQIKNLHKFKESHPNYEKDEDLKHEYMILVNKCTKPLSEHEKKLFKNLCENTYIKDDELMINN